MASNKEDTSSGDRSSDQEEDEDEFEVNAVEGEFIGAYHSDSDDRDDKQDEDAPLLPKQDTGSVEE